MNMNIHRFIVKLMTFASSVFVVLLLMLISGIFIIGCQYEEDYCASLLDKLQRMKSINEPKIILVGNSNLSFGINSEMIENAINMPVVNLGLHGGLSNAFHEDIAKDYIKSGDIVIVCHTTFSDDNRILDPLLAWTTVEYHKDLWKFIRPSDYYDMLRAFPIYWRKALLSLIFKEDSDGIPYSRKNFNKYGDIRLKPVDKRAAPGKILWSKDMVIPEVNQTCADRLNKFNKFVKAKGAVMLAAAYPIGEGKYTPPVEKYEGFQKELAEKLDFDVISDYRDYFIPYKYFYNTVLHLDNEGTKIRTSQLIKDIQNWQKNRKH